MCLVWDRPYEFDVSTLEDIKEGTMHDVVNLPYTHESFGMETSGLP